MQPIYRQSSYRNTATHQPGRAPHAPIPDLTHYKTLLAASAANIEHADQLTQTLADDINYSTSLAENERITTAVNNTINEYTRRDELPDGHPESWYDDRGVFREHEFANWQSRQLAQLTPSEAGYATPEAKQRAIQNTINTRSKLQQQLTAQLANSIPKRARARFHTTLNNCLDRGDFAAATILATQAPENIINPEDKAAIIHNITQRDILTSASRYAASGNPTIFLNYYTSILPKADHATQLKLRQMLRQIQPPAPKAGITRGKNGTITYAEQYPSLPYAVPDYIYDLYTQSGGQPSFKASAELRMQAMQQLRRFAAESLTNPSDPIAIERIKQCATLMGLDEGAATSIITPIQKAYQETAEYNPAKTSAQLLHWRDHATTEQRAYLFSYETTISALESSEDTLTEEQQSALSTARTKLNQLANTIRQQEKEAEAGALAAYSVWETSHPNATKAEKITRYYDLIDNYTHLGHYENFIQYQHEITAAETAEKNLQTLRITYGAQDDAALYAQNTAATDQRRSNPTPATGSTLECTTGLSTHLPKSNEAPIIYLPADSSETSTTIPIRIGRTSIPATVIKTDKVTNAVLSNYLQMQLGILGEPGYNTITLENGIGTLTHTPQASTIADNIIALEARTDKNGNIKEYTLPAADGGGTHEIAGINNKYHPEAYARIKALLDAGKQEEARQAISDHIIHYTQPAADFLTTQGTKSQAAEYMLRDIYFNMGPPGFQRVLTRAFGNTPISTYLTTHTERDLIQQIYTARADYYAAIIRTNPAKAIFRDGWLNRNNKVLATAASLIK